MNMTLQKVLALFRVNTNLSQVYAINGTLNVPSIGDKGEVFVQNLINGGSANFMLSAANNVDNVIPTAIIAGQAAPQAVVSYLYGYDAAGDNWDRLRVAGNNADAVAVEAIGILKQAAALYGFNGATFDRLLSQANNGDAVATSTLGLIKQAGFPYLFNGTTFDRQRGNVEGTALASAARTGNTTSADIINYNGRGIIAFLNVTAVPGVDTINARFQFKDPVSNVYIDSPLIGAVGAFNVQTVSTAAAGLFLFQCGQINNGFLSSIMPRTFRILVTHSAASSFTYSVGYSIMR